MDSSELSQRKRGPRTELSDAQLQNRRDQLVQLFEGDWSRIGLELQMCEKPDDLIRVFSHYRHSYAEEVFSVFCRPSDETVTGAMLRKIRSELRTLVPPSYAVEKSKREAGQQLQKINGAFAKAKNRKIVRRERKKARKEGWKVQQESRTLTAKEKNLRERLRKLEASFARQQASHSLERLVGTQPQRRRQWSADRTTKCQSSVVLPTNLDSQGLVF